MKRILLPVKGSANDVRAAEIAGLIAQDANGMVVILHVDGAEPMKEEEGERISRMKNRLEDLNCIECRMLSVPPKPDPAGAILEEAARGNYDYIIMGAREDTVEGTKIVGKTSRFVLQGSPCPVVIVKNVEKQR